MESRKNAIIAMKSWRNPIVGHWAVLGFLQDFIAMMAFFGILTFVVDPAPERPEGPGPSFAVLRLPPVRRVDHAVHDLQRHLDDVPVPRRVVRLGNLPYDSGAFISIGVGNLLDGMPHDSLEFLEGSACCCTSA